MPPIVHPREVKDLRFSPDGRLLLTACADGQARLWNTETFELVRAFPHRSDVRRVEFSRDGRRILTASDDFTAQVWDTATGERSTPAMPHRHEVWWAEFSPANDLIATASVDGTARVWDARTGRPVTAPLKHRSAVRVACFAPTGDRLATASDDRTFVIWNARTGQPVTEPMLHDAEVMSIAFGSSGQWVVSSAANLSVRFWDAATGQALSEPLFHGDRSVSPSPDGQRVVVASRSGRSRMIEGPEVPVPIPAWMLDLAEALAGERRTQDGIQRLAPAELSRLRRGDRPRKTADFYDRWGDWFYADPKHRALTSTSPRTTDDYLAILLEHGTYECLQEAAELSPNDGAILAQLAELEAAQTPPKSAAARFHLERSLRLAPNDPQVQAVQARLQTLKLKLSPGTGGRAE